MIEFDDCHMAYGQNQVLSGLSFRALDGRVTGLVGPNGAGKSTAFKILLGLVEPGRGGATVDGRRHGEHPNPGQILGTYLGAQHIPPQMTGESFLAFVADLLGVSRAGNAAYLETVGLAHAAQRRVKGYSLGMRQRLGVAAAFVGEPQNLVLDEPVNGLDIEGVRWLRDYLRSAADEGRCILLSSHLLSELELVADDVVMLGQGRTSRTGTLGELRQEASPAVVVVSADDAALAASLEAQGLAARATDRGVEIADLPLLRVAAAVGAQQVPVSSITVATRRLEDVYMEQVEADAMGARREGAPS